MKTPTLVTILLLMAASAIGDTHHVEVDDKTDFAAFKTFAVREGKASSREPEINNKLLLKSIEEAIRSTLSSRGLKETADRPDLIVTFNLEEKGQRGVVGRGIRNAEVIHISEGTLVVEMTRREGNTLLWHGVYSDDEGNAAKLARKLPADAKKLVSEYPPKKKK